MQVQSKLHLRRGWGGRGAVREEVVEFEFEYSEEVNDLQYAYSVYYKQNNKPPALLTLGRVPKCQTFPNDAPDHE